MTIDRADAWDAGPGLLESVWQFRRVVAAATVLVGLAGFGVSFLQPVRYEATARMFLVDPGTSGVFSTMTPSSGDIERYVRNQAERATTRPVARAAAEILDGRLTVDEIGDAVVVESSSEFDLLTIRALDKTPDEAAELANATARAYQQVVSEEVTSRAEAAIVELRESAAQLEGRITELDASLRQGDNPAARAERDGHAAQLLDVRNRIRELSVDAELYGTGVDLLESAEPPEQPASPRPVRNTAAGMALGLLFGSSYGWWRAGRRRSADSPHDPAVVLQAPLLGEVPDFGALGVTGSVPVASAPHSVVAEAYQFILSALEFALPENRGVSVVVTSPTPADGKTTTALNLAAAARKDGRATLLVDGDERVRGLSRLLGLDDQVGMADLADIGIPLYWGVHDQELGGGLTLSVAPAGRKIDDPAAFVRTSGFRTALGRLCDREGLVLVDCPPLLAVSDASAMAGQVDGIVLVVSRGASLQLLGEVRSRLDFIGTPLLGYVFNRTDPRRSRAFGRYSYGYSAEGWSNGNRRPGAPGASPDAVDTVTGPDGT